MTVVELKEEAKRLGLVGYSRLKKAKLEELIATAKAEVMEMSKEEFKESLDTNNEVYEYANEEDWHTLREKRIGGSDVGAILGVNKYKSIIDVYIDKMEGSNFEGNEATFWGHMHESTIMKVFAQKHREFNVYQAPYSVVDNFLVANLDAVLKDKNTGEHGVLEIKTTNAFNYKDWEGDVIPQYYYAQVQHYLMLTGYKFAYIAVLIGGQQYKEFKIERNEEDIELIRNKATEFYQENLLKKIPPMPDGSDAYMNHLKKKAMEIENNEVRELPEFEEIAIRIKELARQKKLIEDEDKLLREKILHKMIEEKTLKAVAGKHKFNISERKTPDIEKMTKENFEVMEKYNELANKYRKVSKYLLVK
ncbi:YqaJ viral recombinase family protein [Fusobacterium polymorphum]|jgi:putative phage-type endonuclease|uniref:lambda-exonuclease family protein n=1 Tax=Fusobacterium nucleatum subsp. polymorphum TaxID=76857 RepID=UPI0030D054C1